MHLLCRLKDRRKIKLIDFNNASFFKLNMVGNDTFRSQIEPILTGSESILSTYKGIRDGVVFTNKRIIAINVQGLTGKKKDLPYKWYVDTVRKA